MVLLFFCAHAVHAASIALQIIAIHGFRRIDDAHHYFSWFPEFTGNHEFPAAGGVIQNTDPIHLIFGVLAPFGFHGLTVLRQTQNHKIATTRFNCAFKSRSGLINVATLTLEHFKHWRSGKCRWYGEQQDSKHRAHRLSLRLPCTQFPRNTNRVQASEIGRKTASAFPALTPCMVVAL